MAAPCPNPTKWYFCVSAAVLMVTLIASPCFCNEKEVNVGQFFKSGHTNNWAVLVCTSRFWFNYRHVANTLSIYRSVKRLGIPDSQIILMLADDMACNARNPRPATVFNNANQQINVYGDDVEVDYRGYEVTVENFIRVLTGRLPPGTPRSKRLMTDDRSNVLVYMTGHGGQDFLKFQDAEEISNVELAHAFQQMWQKKRYHEMLYIIDTCQAVSMFQLFYSPNILAIGSSQIGEDSLSHHVDPAIGVYIIDRYTYYALEFLERVTATSKKTMADFFQVCPQHVCKSTPGVRTDLFSRDISKVPITDFFGSVRNVELSAHTVGLDNETITSDDQVANGDDQVANGDDQVANGDDQVANGDDQVANGDDQVANGDNQDRRAQEPKIEQTHRYGFVEQFPTIEETTEKDHKQHRVQFSGQFVLASTAFLACVIAVGLGHFAS